MQVAFLFDNDGVLIDSMELHWQAWCQLMLEVSELNMSREDFIRGFGKRNDLILEDLIPHIPLSIRKELSKKKEELFRSIAKDNVFLLPGMESFLQRVLEAKIPHIIASSTPVENLNFFLKYTVLGKYFSFYLSAEEVSHGKPAPDVFIGAALKLGFDPKDCIVFEDAPAGIEAGKAAGCFVVALETTHQKQQLKNYDLIYPSALDLDLQEILPAYTSWKAKI